MIYVGIIVIADFLALLCLALLGFSGTPLFFNDALLVAGLMTVVACPLGVVLGFPTLWITRRVAPESPVLLGLAGSMIGAAIPLIFSAGAVVGKDFHIMGAAVGFLSASLWWVLVERHPERRAYYD